MASCVSCVNDDVKVTESKPGSLKELQVIDQQKESLNVHPRSKKISNGQELIQSDPTSCPQNQKGNN